MAKFSVCTLSAPADLKAATPQSTACRMASVPGTRPPISSVRRCRFDSRGEGFKASAITWSAGFCANAIATRNTGRNKHTFTVRIRLELEIKSRKSESAKQSYYRDLLTLARQPEGSNHCAGITMWRTSLGEHSSRIACHISATESRGTPSRVPSHHHPEKACHLRP